jgi:hypothetical protein
MLLISVMVDILVVVVVVVVVRWMRQGFDLIRERKKQLESDYFWAGQSVATH